jgi:hypothetical protein
MMGTTGISLDPNSEVQMTLPLRIWSTSRQLLLCESVGSPVPSRHDDLPAQLPILSQSQYQWERRIANMRRAYELRDNVTACDAAYVALAETLDCELLTGDGRLADAPGPECSFRVLQ